MNKYNSNESHRVYYYEMGENEAMKKRKRTKHIPDVRTVSYDMRKKRTVVTDHDLDTGKSYEMYLNNLNKLPRMFGINPNDAIAGLDEAHTLERKIIHPPTEWSGDLKIRAIENEIDKWRVEENKSIKKWANQTKLECSSKNEKVYGIAIKKGNFNLCLFAWLDISANSKKLREIKQHFVENLEETGFCGATKIKGSWWHGYTMRIYFENDIYSTKAYNFIIP